MLEIYRSEVHGVLHIAQAQWRYRRVEASLEAQEHAQALSSLLALARQGTELQISARAWRELVTLGLDVALQGNLKSGLGELFEQYAWLGWSGKGPDSMPWEVLEVLERADARSVCWTLASYLGDLLARAYPTCALGPWAGAHFRERAHLAHGTLTPAQMRANASRFERAAALAQSADRDAFARHCQLRQGTSALIGGVDKAAGRALLRGFRASDLSTQERLWYALGMSASDFWLDRVRAADVLDGLAEAAKDARPGKQDVDLSTLRTFVRYLSERETLELQGPEQDRMEALVENLFEGSARQEMTQLLDLHVSLQSSLSGLLTDSESVIVALRVASRDLGGRWSKAASSLDFLANTQNFDSIPRIAPEPFLRHAHHALEILHALGHEDDGALEQALLETRASWSEEDPAPTSLRPLSAAWPKLLERLGRRSAADEERAQLDYMREITSDIARLWAPQAPEPSYGWWNLSAHFLRAKMPIGAEALARRAVRSMGTPEPEVRDFVLGRLMAWSIERGDKVLMSRWLEVGESVYMTTGN